MKKLNILHWPTSYPDPIKGHPYNCIFVEEHIKSLRDVCNNRVLYISSENVSDPGKWYQRIDTEENSVPVTRFYFNKSLNKYFLNYYIRLMILLFFIRLVVKEKFVPHIIHIHFYQSLKWADLYSRILGCRVVITEHWTAFLGWRTLSEARYKEAGYSFRAADHILPVSQKSIEGIRQYTGEDVSGKSTVIFNAVDTSVFNFSTDGSREDLIFVGRNAEVKDLPTLLQAFRLVVNERPLLHLHMVGDGDFYDIGTLIGELELSGNITLHGAKSKQSISDLMQQCSILVLSSLVENSPCVIGEAHCCGLSVVATDVGGVKELIISGDTVPARSPEHLASQIIKTLNLTPDRKGIAEQAEKLFSHEAIGKQLLNVYQKISTK